MSYKQTVPNMVGWQPQPGQPTVPDMWAQQRQMPLDPTQHDLRQFQFRAQPSQQMMDMCRGGMFGAPMEGGVMGPPPIPQKPMGNGMTPGYPMMGSPFPPQQMMGPRMGFQGTLGDGLPPSRPVNDHSMDSSRVQMVQGFNNKDSFSKFHQVGHRNEIGNPNPPQSLPVIQGSEMQAAHIRSNDNQLSAGMTKHASEHPNLKAFTSDLSSNRLNNLQASSTPGSTTSNKTWNSKSAQGVTPTPSSHQQEMPRSPATTPSSSISATVPPSSLTNDLQNVLATLLSSNNDMSTDSVSSDGKSPLPAAPHVTSTTPLENQKAAGLPGFNRLLPPLPSNQSILNPDSQGLADDESDKDKPKRRRRKRCGTCAPCQVREDCGECYVCRNKGQVNAICKLRKCLLLRKKVGFNYI